MDAFLSHCMASISGNQPVLWALFLGGLTGGFTHCLAMCGGFAACRTACGGCGSASQTLNLAHHLGRATSYGALGLMVAWGAQHVAAFAFWPQLEALMLVLAGMMFLASALFGAAHPHHLFGAGRTTHTYLRGALLGFMPCGLIYAALMVVAASADPLFGFIGMVVFVLGTLPALWLAGAGVALLARRWREEMRRLGRVALALNAMVLFVAAGKLVM